MKWTESDELKACLGILAQHTKVSFDAEEIHTKWPVGSDGERPTVRDIKERFEILKKRAVKSYGSYKAHTTQAVQKSDRRDAQLTENPDPLSAFPVLQPADSVSSPTVFPKFFIDLTGQSAVTPVSKTCSLQQKSKSSPSTSIHKPATPSRKRKVTDSNDSSDADDSATKYSPRPSTSTSSRLRSTALRAKVTPKYQIDDFVSFSPREIPDSEDSDTTFDLKEFRKTQAKERAKAVSGGRKRGRRGQGPSPRVSSTKVPAIAPMSPCILETDFESSPPGALSPLHVIKSKIKLHSSKSSADSESSEELAFERSGLLNKSDSEYSPEASPLESESEKSESQHDSTTSSSTNSSSVYDQSSEDDSETPPGSGRAFLSRWLTKPGKSQPTAATSKRTNEANRAGKRLEYVRRVKVIQSIELDEQMR